MQIANYWAFYILVCFCSLFHAQERPPINLLYPEDYGGESQNWSITQSEERYIYVANNRGLLEYNGAKWTLYKSPNETIIRSVKVIDSLIYTGSYRDFGFWKRDNSGVLNYTSLSKQIKVDFLEDEEFWNILHLDNWILFQSLDRIHIYNKETKAYDALKSETNISKLFKLDDIFYFQNLNNGLYRIEKGKGILVSEDTVIKNDVVINMFKHQGAILILTQDSGIHKLLGDGKLVTWNSAVNNILKDISVFSGIQLRDKSYALGTISDGVVHFTSEGKLNYKIDQSNGLSNNTVLSIFEDFESNLWLGLDNGINCINMKSPYHIYFDKNGTIGSVYASMAYENRLYLGTNQGLFSRPLEATTDFDFVEGTQGQVWSLTLVDSTLFCGHNSGTFTVKDNKASKIANTYGTWQIQPIKGNRDLLIQGNYYGLNILERKNGNWQLRNKLQGFNVSSRYFEFSNDREIFVNHEYKGVFKLKIDKQFTKVLTYALDTLVEKGLYSSLIKHQGDLLYTSKNGIYKYDKSKARFKKDSIFNKLIDNKTFITGKLVSDPKDNKLWGFTPKGLNYLTTSKLSGGMKINTLAFPVHVRKEVVGYENITRIKDDNYLFGTSFGYIVVDLQRTIDNEYDIKINQVALSRFKKKDSATLVDVHSKATFESRENSIRFSYSVPNFNKAEQPEYKYRLKGMYEFWSDWKTDATVFFENLPFGNYRFEVKGRYGNKETLNTASYSFKIKRPWFLSNTAIALYALGLLLILLLIHNLYKRYYRRQREQMMLKAEREFNLKELEGKQQFMYLKNEKLREDIENKNRELGISTMNLIKKNEFLGIIKKELEKTDDGKGIKRVIKIIDKNLNNNDDWNLFQEAFNNADKDFLKKIKSMHPKLTSNDLRLCAYLRLNLSSKEIAPLLNISPRSVEVKRYRLRKKMNLPHSASLSDYILEI